MELDDDTLPDLATAAASGAAFCALSAGSHAFVRCYGERCLRCTWVAFPFGFAGGHPLLANNHMVKERGTCLKGRLLEFFFYFNARRGQRPPAPACALASHWHAPFTFLGTPPPPSSSARAFASPRVARSLLFHSSCLAPRAIAAAATAFGRPRCSWRARSKWTTAGT